MEALWSSSDDITMCQGVYYTQNGVDTRLYFPNPAATLPIRTRQGSLVFLPWGRRKTQAGRLPLGGWASLDAIYAGRWDRWFPVPVKVMVKSFSELDIEEHCYWFDLVKGQFLQGLVAREGHERRVYVVTVDPRRHDAQFKRWPKIISGHVVDTSKKERAHGFRKPLI